MVTAMNLFCNHFFLAFLSIVTTYYGTLCGEIFSVVVTPVFHGRTYDILFSVSVQRSRDYRLHSHDYDSMEGDLRVEGSHVK